jgi:hypothetical protein
MLDLYFWPTPNGKKVTIQLAEAGIPYSIKEINIGRGDLSLLEIPSEQGNVSGCEELQSNRSA